LWSGDDSDVLLLRTGLLVFVFSDFVPTSRFALLITLLLMLALIRDLLLLPALLLSPMPTVASCVFKRKHGVRA